MDQLDFLKILGVTQEPMMSVGQATPVDPMTSVMLQAKKERKPKQAVAMPVPSNSPAAPEYLRQEIVASQVLSPEDEEMIRDLRTKFKDMATDQVAKAEEMRALTREEMAKDSGKIDWTPAAGLIKAFGGPDITGVAAQAAPMGREDKLKMRMLLEKAAQEPESKVLSEIGEILKGAQSGKFQIESARENSKQSRFEAGQLRQKESELQKDLSKSVFTPMSEHQQTMGGMKELINKGDVASVQQALSNFARSVAGQKGVLTDADIALVYPQNLEMKIAKAQAFLSSNPNVPLPPEIKKSLMEGIDIAQRNAKKVFQEKAATMKNLYSTRQSYKDIMAPGAFGPSAFGEVEKRLQGFGGEESPTGALGNEFDAWKKYKGY